MWNDATPDPRVRLANVTDVVFKIDCAALPVDHAYLLSTAICESLPWMSQSTDAGVHPIHVAGSQNGWERPEADEKALLMLSKRTRLKIRVNSDQAAELIDTLSNMTLKVDQHTIHVLSGQIRTISPSATLHSRYTWFDHESASNDEAGFVDHVVEQCQKIGFAPSKILCGRSHRVACKEENLLTRSVMLADVPAEHSIRLQETGLGAHRLIGCGLLIPHKDTGAVERS